MRHFRTPIIVSRVIHFLGERSDLTESPLVVVNQHADSFDAAMRSGFKKDGYVVMHSDMA